MVNYRVWIFYLGHLQYSSDKLCPKPCYEVFYGSEEVCTERSCTGRHGVDPTLSEAMGERGSAVLQIEQSQYAEDKLQDIPVGQTESFE